MQKQIRCSILNIRSAGGVRSKISPLYTRGLIIAEVNFSRFVRQRFVVLEAASNDRIEALEGYPDEIS